MTLVVSFDLNGIHHWPGAPNEYREFRQPHRHLFKFLFRIPVTGPRSVELFNAREFLIESVLAAYPSISGGDLLARGIDFGPSSCEDIAQKMKSLLGAEKVFVGEDWYLGAEV